ncbi:MAG: efflux RND transporter periplasmic adaptor subunit [Spirochaetes bacterium]|nr:efflux RND transporter periplasmic adaptor subunit [Spirochaetota bacterium]
MKHLPAAASRKTLASLTFIVLAAGGCARREQAPAAIAPQRVRTVLAAERMTAQELASYGSISFQKKADVTARVDGTVTELSAVEGASVEKGDLLARLTNIQLELRKRQAESAASSARSELALAQARLWEGQLQVEARIAGIERSELELASKRRELEELAKTLKNKEQLLSVGGTTEEAMTSLRLSYAATETGVRLMEKDLEIRRIGLRDADIVSRGLTVPRDEAARRRMLVQIGTQTLAAETEVARARADSAAVELGAAEQLLAELDIRAPLSGIVGARYVEAGEHAAADAKLVTLISTGEVYAVFPVSETESQRVAPGAAVDVSVDALGGAPFRARVALISPLIDPQAGTVTVKAILANPSMRMKPGMFVRVKLVYGSPRRVIVIPASAIAQKKGNTARVFTVVNRRVFAKEATLGQELGDSWTVEDGLRAGESLVDSPSLLLREGEEVETE